MPRSNCIVPAYRLPADVAARLAQRQAALELSPREREVLELIVKGRSNKEIGSALGVQARTQAATTAIQRGIVRL